MQRSFHAVGHAGPALRPPDADQRPRRPVAGLAAVLALAAILAVLTPAFAQEPPSDAAAVPLRGDSYAGVALSAVRLQPGIGAHLGLHRVEGTDFGVRFGADLVFPPTLRIAGEALYEVGLEQDVQVYVGAGPRLMLELGGAGPEGPEAGLLMGAVAGARFGLGALQLFGELNADLGVPTWEFVPVLRAGVEVDL